MTIEMTREERIMAAAIIMRDAVEELAIERAAEARQLEAVAS